MPGILHGDRIYLLTRRLFNRLQAPHCMYRYSSLALYINSPEVLKLYSRPEPLWLVCLLITFWVSRMLILTNRGRMTDDPIVFAFKDRSSHIVVGLITICVFLAL